MTQAALPLEPVAPPPLREAYERTDLAQMNFTYAQAVADELIGPCLRNMAEAIARKAK